MANAANVKTPAAATAAVYTHALVAGKKAKIDGVTVSYGATPTGGNLLIESPTGTTIFSTDIPTAGTFTICPPNGFTGNAGNEMVVTLASGGGSVVGKLVVHNPRSEK